MFIPRSTFIPETKVGTSDEPELEFSGSSRAEPSWGISISELKRAGDFSRFIAFLAQTFLSCFRCMTFFRRKTIIHYKER